MRLPQAIFTSVRGQKIAGYQLAARSEEIGEELAHELTVWGPAHDSLLEEDTDEPSINFHPLGPDHFCLSLTRSAGEEYSGRGGARIYTQMFVLTREALARFDHNPLLILRAIETSGRLITFEDIPDRIRSIPLVGRTHEATALDGDELQVETDSLAPVAAAVLKDESLGVATSLPPRRFLSLLLRQIPREERLKVSFTTGLRPSPRRPFRLCLLPSDPVARRPFLRQAGLTVFELETSNSKVA